MNLIVSASSKIKLSAVSNEAQNNFLVFLEKRLCENGLSEANRIANSKLNLLVKRSFFDNVHKNHLIEIIAKSGAEANIKLLFNLVNHYYKIADLIKNQKF